MTWTKADDARSFGQRGAAVVRQLNAARGLAESGKLWSVIEDIEKAIESVPIAVGRAIAEDIVERLLSVPNEGPEHEGSV